MAVAGHWLAFFRRFFFAAGTGWGLGRFPVFDGGPTTLVRDGCSWPPGALAAAVGFAAPGGHSDANSLETGLPSSPGTFSPRV
jgi:hypothetical protein